MQISIRRTLTFLVLLPICQIGSAVRAGNPPSSIDEAYQRVAELLGHPQEPAQLTRFVVDEEIETHPEEDGPTVIVANNGLKVFTNPTIQGKSIVYSENEILDRDVFNEYTDGKRNLNQHLDRTYAVETKITKFPTLWVAQRRIVNHSLPRFSGLISGRGIVKWLDDGVEFSLSGFDSMYAPDGTLMPIAYVNVQRLRLDGERLVTESSFQAYQMAEDPDGNKLLVPDLEKPIGKVVKNKRVSEPRKSP